MKKNWIIIGASLLVLSGLMGCANQESSRKNTATSATTLAPKEEKADTPTITVAGLKEGEKVKAGDLKLAISLAGHELVNFKDHQEAKQGQGHIHIWLDTDPSNPKAALKVVQEPSNIILKDVKSGEHTLVIRMVGNDHKPIAGSEPQTIKFTAE